MKVEFDKSFLKYLSKIKDDSLLAKIENIISEIEQIDEITKIRNCQKLSGFKSYYRIRLGNYRLGFEIIDTATLRLLIIAHRKDIYKKFP